MNINFENVKDALYRGKHYIKIYSGSTLEWEYESEPMEQTTKQIWYNSISGDVVEPYSASSIGNLVSNTAYETKCVLEFRSDVTAIGANAFSGCTDLEYVSLPASATSIGANAFDGCSSLEDIFMPSVESIGREAFKDCGFSSFTISSAVTAITADAFKGVEMKSFNYGGTKAQWSAITIGDFWDEDNWLTNVVHCSDGDIELFPRNYSKEYFTIEITTAGNLYYGVQYGSDNKMLMSLDNGATWVNAVSATKSFNVGDKIMFKANIKYTDSTYPAITINTSTTPKASFITYGNTMSLYYGDDFKGKTTLTKTYALNKLFSGATTLTSAKNLILPATTLVSNCYQGMFNGCTSLTAAPQLPATTLSNNCYESMFRGCTSLTTSPSLSAATMASYCYANMFANCTSLTAATPLSATTLASQCYLNMYNGCTNLTTAPSLPATTLADFCYSGMFMGCGLITSIELPATTLVMYCYSNMFSGCTSLNYIKMLATDVSATNCLNNWVNSVASSGTFIKDPSMATLPTGDSGIPSGWNVYNDGDKALDYLTFVANSGGTINFSGSSTANTISYSKNNGEWSTPTQSVSVNVNSGDTIMWKGNMTPTGDGIGRFSGGTSTFDAQGNIMSLLYGDNYLDQTSLRGKNNAFKYLFQSSKVVSAENLILPATTLSDNCYESMLRGCTSLTTAPSLSATTMTSYCYATMFKDCTSLTTAPELPATTLASRCYNDMFDKCTSLTTAPELPATTLADFCYSGMFMGCRLITSIELPATTLVMYCYNYMFSGCTSLNYIKMLATDVSATNCLNNWVKGVAATGTFIKDPSMTSLPTGNSGIPSGWNVYDNGYGIEYMTLKAKSGGTINFSGSSTANTLSYSKNNGEWSTPSQSVSLNVNSGDTIMLKGNMTPTSNGIGTFSGGTATFDAQGNIMSLLYGDNYLGQTSLSGKNNAFKYLFQSTKVVSAENLILPTTLANGCYSTMFAGSTTITTPPQLNASALTQECYSYMFSGCTSLATAPSLSATTLSPWCYNNMFKGCSSLTTAPDLLASTLTDYCYYSMFSGCTNLNYIKMYATDISASHCMDFWVDSVANSGTFVKYGTDIPVGRNGIPSGWTVQDDAPTPTHDYSQDYFTIVAKESGDITLYISSYPDSNYDDQVFDVQYSLDNGSNWESVDVWNDDGVWTAMIPVESGDTLLFKCDMVSGVNKNMEYQTYKPFEMPYSPAIDVQGNIMSLIYGDNFTGQTSLLYGQYDITFNFNSLFYGNNIENAENLILPATDLSEHCYNSMFRDCTSLTTAPSVLPATTLSDSCYYYMFNGCSNLNYIKMLATDISASDCLTDWVQGVAATGTFVKNANATIPTGNSGIPSGWTVQNA